MISKLIATEYDGMIEFVSEPGVGTEFIVKLKL